MDQIRLYRDGDFAVAALASEGVWQEAVRAAFDLLHNPHYAGAFENLPKDPTDSDAGAVAIEDDASGGYCACKRWVGRPSKYCWNCGKRIEWK